MTIGAFIHSPRMNQRLRFDATRTGQGWQFAFGDMKASGNQCGLIGPRDSNTARLGPGSPKLDFVGMMTLHHVQLPYDAPDFWGRAWSLLDQGICDEAAVQAKFEQLAAWIDTITESFPGSQIWQIT